MIDTKVCPSCSPGPRCRLPEEESLRKGKIHVAAWLPRCPHCGWMFDPPRKMARKGPSVPVSGELRDGTRWWVDPLC